MYFYFMQVHCQLYTCSLFTRNRKCLLAHVFLSEHTLSIKLSGFLSYFFFWKGGGGGGGGREGGCPIAVECITNVYHDMYITQYFYAYFLKPMRNHKYKYTHQPTCILHTYTQMCGTLHHASGFFQFPG